MIPAEYDEVGDIVKWIFWAIVVGVVAAVALRLNTDDIRRFIASFQPTPAPVVVVVVTATPADTPTGTSTATLVPSLTPTSTLAPVIAAVPAITATRTPIPTATLRPTFTPTVTRTATSTATGTATGTPTTTPTVTATAFVCGRVEMVLMGAGKEHKHCHTPTPTLAPGATRAAAPTFTPVPANTTTPTQTATGTPIPTNTPRVVVVALKTNTPAPTAPPISTIVHTATPILTQEQTDSPHLRHLAEKQYMLELINSEREKAGLERVVLGDNIAAQLHAESALENCFFSHWGMDGLKPYMRYSLAGGYQSNGENGHGGLCIRASDGYAPLRSVKWGVERAMKSLMGSPDHRRNILNRQHKKVNIGVAFDRYNMEVAQHFEGDYVEYDELSSIENGTLYLSGRTKNGTRFDKKEDLGVALFYDPPPHPLTHEDVSDTYAYCYGLHVAGFVWPLTGGGEWGDEKFDSNYEPCPGDPYSASYDENTKGDWIVAKEWTAAGTTFAIKADISNVLEKYGEGVYSVMLWGDIDGERAVISEYSIFHGITPPNAYTPP